ncbi:MAG: ABC transporter ATP-binding protein [Bacteroidetes bacterium RIFCSPLOWO2_12_FULL_35_15]|nr:MAG: ABC transporter ATP-binding protein [Bacteroidetes bacterium RIFCSPLOWO2_12_FULL_35_15]
MNSTIAVEVNQLVKIYKGSTTPAVNNISFTIDSGTIFGLLGPNGAGKTTTISMLCGLIKPSSGDAKLLGFSIATHLEDIKQQIGVVPQEIALYPTLTAFENLRYIGNMYGLKGESLKKNIYEHLEIVGLQAQSNKRVETFSGGMKRRINLIAAILHKPQILFLDEPTVGVDVQSRNLITEHLRLINKQGCTIIYTSHLMEEAENLCSDIAIIDKGEIIISGKPKKLIAEHSAGNLEQLFLKLTGKKLRD